MFWGDDGKGSSLNIKLRGWVDAEPGSLKWTKNAVSVQILGEEATGQSESCL